METVALAGRMLIALAVVLGFMWVIARRLKKPGRAGSTTLVDVLARRQLSRNASVAVVRVLDQALIVGITEGHISLIGETELEAAERAIEKPAPRRSPRPARPQPGRAIGPDGRIVEAPRPTPMRPRTPALAGSALSPDTWRQTIQSLRGRTARRS